MAEDSEPEASARGRPCGTQGANIVGSLRALLRSHEAAYRSDIALYTSGHLNPSNLYKPPEKIFHHWRNAYRPGEWRPSEAEKRAESQAARMKDRLARFTLHTALRPSDAPGTPLFRYLHPPAGLWRSSEEDVATKPSLRRRREELAWPEMKVLRSKAARSSRQCALEAPGRDEYCHVNAYLAGVTKADKYRKFLHFQKEVLAVQDLLENDYTGGKVAARYEERLEQDLSQVCSCDPWDLHRLQVFSQVFEDICNGSLIFGDILREVKEEYELYMAILLDTQPTEQYQKLLAEAKGLEKSSVKTADVTQARAELRALVAATNAALKRNDRLRSELEEEQGLLQRAQESAVSLESSEKNVKKEEQLTLMDKVKWKRSEILNKLDEIQALEKEMKTTLVHTGGLHLTENRSKSIETETIKLERANSILSRKIEIIESQVKQFLVRSKMSGDEQRNLWEFIKEYVGLNETDNYSQVDEKNDL